MVAGGRDLLVIDLDAILRDIGMEPWVPPNDAQTRTPLPFVDVTASVVFHPDGPPVMTLTVEADE